MWPFRKRPEPDPEPEGVSFPATPYAGLLADLIAMGLTAPQAVYVVHLVELAHAQAELRIKAEVNMAAAQVHKPRPVRQRVKKAGANSGRANKRAYMKEYMRKRRAKLHVVCFGHTHTIGAPLA